MRSKKTLSILLNVLLLLIVLVPLKAEELTGLGWKAKIDGKKGHITEMQILVNGKEETIPFRGDSMGGPSFEGVQLQRVAGKKLTFEGRLGQVVLLLYYQAAGDHLKVICNVRNEGPTAFNPLRLRLRVGVDGEMHTYPAWDEKFFPTLMRCEKNYAWGYLMSPRGVIVALGVEDPVASEALNYIQEDKKEWCWGHQVLTESFDLLHHLPLPSRHPQNLTELAPGESRTWTFHLGGVAQLSSLKPCLAAWLKVPMVELERYTLDAGEETPLTVTSPAGIRSAVLTSEDGRTQKLVLRRLPMGSYRTLLSAPEKTGVYTLTVVAKNGKQSEARFYVRHSWAWYLGKARDWAAQYPPIAGGSAEQYYGYYAAALGSLHVPDKEKDTTLEKIFERRICLMIDTAKGIPLNQRVLPKRIQNFATMAGILVDYWRATGKMKYLRWASRIGDFLCSDSVQWADGSYRSNQTHYTAVIYPAKSMMELAAAEKEAAKKDPEWMTRSEKHLNSATRAAEDLAKRLDNIETEGDMTFEDGMITCSALQLGLCGLTTSRQDLREKMVEAARYMMDKHRCLEQLLIPDCRMRGATLRFWEALDVYFSPNQVMNSPHGWTSWKMYAEYYLYLLTGEEKYLTDLMNTMGACAQVINGKGKLRWGFIPDPYVDSWVCVPDKNNVQGWNHRDSIVGEQYLDVISPWCRPSGGDQLCDFGQRGGAGDNTVYEIFKAMEECALTTAFVIVEPTGEVKSWNCRAQLSDGGRLKVSALEACVEKLHVNTARALQLNVTTPVGEKQFKADPGLQMIPLTGE